LGGLGVWESNIKMKFEKVMYGKQCNGFPGSVKRERLLVFASG